MSTQEELEAIPVHDTSSLPALSALVVGIIITVAQVVAFGLHMAYGDTVFYILVPALYPAFWAIITLATIASVIYSHYRSRQIKRLGLGGQRFLTWALVLGYINLGFEALAIAATVYVFWIFSTYTGY